MIFTVSSLLDLPLVAEKIIAFANDNRVFLFYGEMGAGKTTLIKEICNVLEVDGEVSSPTFSIVNEYTSPKGMVYHFDFYRLKRETEALDLGYEDYFYSGNYCLVEWPEKISSLLPDYYIIINIKLCDDNARTVEVLQH